ncbi:hypothetical protein M9Y10_036686 [Tritrichomonas musculus]|uniref:Beta-lactamase n=1 Tax=Tritrichomonas musculus TaxID=1915356 RepID=A0ABR2GUB9_9EUKA
MPLDINKAFHYFKLSANQNYLWAQYFLGFAFYKKQDIKKALYYFEISGKQDFRLSQLILGDFYLEGKHVDRDINKSIKYYKDLSNLNNEHAKNNLGVIYKNGFENINKNILLAKEYFKE